MQIRVHLDTVTRQRFEQLVNWTQAVRMPDSHNIPPDILALLQTGDSIARHGHTQLPDWQEVIQEVQLAGVSILMCGVFELEVEAKQRLVSITGLTPWMSLQPGEEVPEPMEYIGLLAVWRTHTDELTLALMPEPPLEYPDEGPIT